MKTYKIEWVDKSSYYTYIEADTPEEALEKFESGELTSIEPGDYVEFVEGSIDITEV